MTQCQKCSAPADVFLCRDCSRELWAQLEHIPQLSEWLADAHTKQTALTATPQPRRPKPENPDDEESPMPFDDRARAMFDELRTVCMRWVRDFSDQFDARAEVDAMRDIPTTAELARFLHKHHQDIVLSEDAGLCAQEIDRTVRRAVKVLNQRKRVFCGPCPTVVGEGPRRSVLRCEVGLYAEWNDQRDEVEPHVTCWKCRTQHDVAALRQAVFSRADNFLFTLDELLRVLDELGEHLPRVRFYEWRREGAIRPRGYRRDGRITLGQQKRGDPAVFELAEVRGLMAQEMV